MEEKSLKIVMLIRKFLKYLKINNRVFKIFYCMRNKEVKIKGLVPKYVIKKEAKFGFALYYIDL